MNDNIQLESARVEDAEWLKEIGVRGWETTYAGFVSKANRETYLNGDFWSIERLKTVLSHPDAINLVARQDGQIIGFITTEKLEDGRFEVTRLYVDPEIRSKGVGARLLQTVFNQLREQGVPEALVNVFGDNHAGRRFYERHGFRLTEDTWCMVGDQCLSDVWYAVQLNPERNR